MDFINKNMLNKYKIIKHILVIFLYCTLLQTTALASEVKFSLQPIESKESKLISTWAISVPDNVMNKHSQLVLKDENNMIIQADFSYALLWPSDNTRQYIRSLTISSGELQRSKSDLFYSLEWQEGTTENITDAEKQLSITHHANVSAAWLALSFYAPLKTSAQNKKITWFDNANIRYGKFMADPSLLNKKYQFDLNTAAIWLYDRPFNFYLLYLKTGDLYWKTKAHEASEFYRSHINNEGYFSLKEPNDFKYAYTQGLVLDYIFYPNKDTKEVIERIYKMTSSWPTEVKKEGFWTERHHSVALTSAISQWVISNDTNTLKRIRSFVSNTANYLAYPYNGSCLKHSYLSHNGKKSDTQVCSPWMTALLVEQFWRFYHLTFDYKSAHVIEMFSDFLINEGIFYFTYGKEYSAVPRYLATINSTKKGKYNAWSDLHHACDVASAIAKAAYLKKIQNKEHSTLTLTLKNMLKTCRRSMHRSNSADAWPVNPPRKFNWWYGSAASFTWLLNELDI
tara:strand:- start:975 stop:2507 length:1533 start_codon:yes stop_codon:yes gene_type:complete